MASRRRRRPLSAWDYKVEEAAEFIGSLPAAAVRQIGQSIEFDGKRVGDTYIADYFEVSLPSQTIRVRSRALRQVDFFRSTQTWMTLDQIKTAESLEEYNHTQPGLDMTDVDTVENSHLDSSTSTPAPQPRNDECASECHDIDDVIEHAPITTLAYDLRRPGWNNPWTWDLECVDLAESTPIRERVSPLLANGLLTPTITPACILKRRAAEISSEASSPLARRPRLSSDCDLDLECIDSNDLPYSVSSSVPTSDFELESETDFSGDITPTPRPSAVYQRRPPQSQRYMTGMNARVEINQSRDVQSPELTQQEVLPDRTRATRLSSEVQGPLSDDSARATARSQLHFFKQPSPEPYCGYDDDLYTVSPRSHSPGAMHINQSADNTVSQSLNEQMTEEKTVPLPTQATVASNRVNVDMLDNTIHPSQRQTVKGLSFYTSTHQAVIGWDHTRANLEPTHDGNRTAAGNAANEEFDFIKRTLNGIKIRMAQFSTHAIDNQAMIRALTLDVDLVHSRLAQLQAKVAKNEGELRLVKRDVAQIRRDVTQVKKAEFSHLASVVSAQQSAHETRR